MTDDLFEKAYRGIAMLDAAHRVEVVQNRYSAKLFVRKTLTRYSLPVFGYLREHPVQGMPAVLDFAEHDGTLTVIEEYIHGDTLQYLLENRGVFGEEEAVRIALALCPILRELHGADPPIIHRDIKPANVMLTADGAVKLLDMDAARQMDPGKMRDTVVLGTAGYAAPEQYGFVQSGVPADIYAMGVLLNVMLTGELPSVRRAEGRAATVIRRCTELSPKDRFASVEELEQALRRVVRERRERAWQRFLPPGFRSLEPYRCASTLALYAMGFYVTTTVEIEGASAAGLFVNRLGATLWFAAVLLFNGNYLGLRRFFPGMRARNRWVRFLLIFLYDVIFFVLTVIFIGCAERMMI